MAITGTVPRRRSGRIPQINMGGVSFLANLLNKRAAVKEEQDRIEALQLGLEEYGDMGEAPTASSDPRFPTGVRPHLLAEAGGPSMNTDEISQFITAQGGGELERMGFGSDQLRRAYYGMTQSPSRYGSAADEGNAPRFSSPLEDPSDKLDELELQAAELTDPGTRKVYLERIQKARSKHFMETNSKMLSKGLGMTEKELLSFGSLKEAKDFSGTRTARGMAEWVEKDAITYVNEAGEEMTSPGRRHSVSGKIELYPDKKFTTRAQKPQVVRLSDTDEQGITTGKTVMWYPDTGKTKQLWGNQRTAPGTKPAIRTLEDGTQESTYATNEQFLKDPTLSRPSTKTVRKFRDPVTGEVLYEEIIEEKAAAALGRGVGNIQANFINNKKNSETLMLGVKRLKGRLQTGTATGSVGSIIKGASKLVSQARQALGKFDTNVSVSDLGLPKGFLSNLASKTAATETDILSMAVLLAQSWRPGGIGSRSGNPPGALIKLALQRIERYSGDPAQMLGMLDSIGENQADMLEQSAAAAEMEFDREAFLNLGRTEDIPDSLWDVTGTDDPELIRVRER